MTASTTHQRLPQLLLEVPKDAFTRPSDDNLYPTVLKLLEKAREIAKDTGRAYRRSFSSLNVLISMKFVTSKCIRVTSLLLFSTRTNSIDLRSQLFKRGWKSTSQIYWKMLATLWTHSGVCSGKPLSDCPFKWAMAWMKFMICSHVIDLPLLNHDWAYLDTASILSIFCGIAVVEASITEMTFLIWTTFSEL